MHPIFLALFAVIVVGLALLAIKMFSVNKSDKEHNKPIYNYKRKDFLISRPEHEFFNILVEIVGNQYNVFPQVHLATIFNNKVVGQSWRGAFRHINEKSVDFVICDKAYIKPLIAIELDDKSHDMQVRKDRDTEVERIFRESDMTLLRFENHGSFDKEQIRTKVLEALGK